MRDPLSSLETAVTAEASFVTDSWILFVKRRKCLTSCRTRAEVGMSAVHAAVAARLAIQRVVSMHEVPSIAWQSTLTRRIRGEEVSEGSNGNGAAE